MDRAGDERAGPTCEARLDRHAERSHLDRLLAAPRVEQRDVAAVQPDAEPVRPRADRFRVAHDHGGSRPQAQRLADHLRTDPGRIPRGDDEGRDHTESFTSIAASREKLAGARTPAETIAASNEQSAALSRLLVVVENYPNLKSDANFQRLMDDLSGTENRIANERMRYNERVQEYNTLRRRFPANMTAKVFGFKEYPYFEAPAAAQQLPKVNFGR